MIYIYNQKHIMNINDGWGKSAKAYKNPFKSYLKTL